MAGTKGKGSTSAFIEQILRDQGLTTALFTSPHLISPCERIRINGKSISEEEFTETFYTCYDTLISHPTWIPHFYGTALLMFLKLVQDKNLDVAIVEVGIGGRFDETNYIIPQVSVLTLIDYDHIDKLGNTLESIAWHKAGIMKVNILSIIKKKKTTSTEGFSVFLFLFYRLVC